MPGVAWEIGRLGRLLPAEVHELALRQPSAGSGANLTASGALASQRALPSVSPHCTVRVEAWKCQSCDCTWPAAGIVGKHGLEPATGANNCADRRRGRSTGPQLAVRRSHRCGRQEHVPGRLTNGRLAALFLVRYPHTAVDDDRLPWPTAIRPHSPTEVATT